MDTLLQDLRYAVRTLVRTPGFTAVAVLTLALGIGVTTALYSGLDAMLLRPLPVQEPERLVEIAPVIESSMFRDGAPPFSHPALQALRERNRSMAGIAASTRAQVTFGDEEYAEEIAGRFVTGNYFGVLGIRPALGRLVLPADDQRDGATGGVVISHRLWRERFGSDPAVVGRTVRVNGFPVVVLGVVPREFTGTAIDEAPQLWAPLALHEQVVPNSRVYDAMTMALWPIGRLRPGVTLEQARAELGGILRQFDEADASPMKMTGVELRGVNRIPGKLEGAFHRFVALLAAATALVLMIASVNVAGMLLVRATRRQREIAIRLAIGAGRGRLLRQLVTEGVLLSLIGGAAGVLLAVWLTDLLLSFRWPIPVTLDLGINARVLGFALMLSLLTGLGFSLLPALRASRPDLVPALKETVQAPARGRAPLRSAFVVSQMAMSLLLLVGAGLFLRALQHALSIEPGFSPQGVRVASINLLRQRYDDERGQQLLQQVLERARQVPGVESASLSISVPLGPGGELLEVEPVGATAPPPRSTAGGPIRAEAIGADGAKPNGRAFVNANIVDPEYFRTMAIPLLRGRTFSDADRVGAPGVAIVNQAMAERFWPGEDPIGKRIKQQFSAFELLMGKAGGAEPKEFEVVGVVPSGKYSSLREDPEPHIFLPFAQNYRSEMVLAIRTRDDAAVAAQAVRDQVRALDPHLPVLALTPLTHLIGDKLLPQRIGAILTTSFGVLGLLLAAVGIYGVMAYSVSQRTREIGIRMALGARREDVLGLVVGRGLVLTGVGIGLGLAAALAATRFISSLLYGVSATDPLAFGGVTLLLAIVALLASYLPARRATRVDPMVALRSE